MQLAPTDGLPSDILRVHVPMANIFVLRDEQELYLIDTGLLFARPLLKRALRQASWDHLPLRGIILTHGHLDHTLNAAALQSETGAWVTAPRLDRPLVEADFHCSGWGRVGQWLQQAGAALFRYRPPGDVHWYEPGHVFDILGGLEVIGLPGHTPGHCGLLCQRDRLLFCADLFASRGFWAHMPPAIFNHDGAAIPAALQTALALQPSGVAVNHGQADAPQTHLRRLQRLAGKNPGLHRTPLG